MPQSKNSYTFPPNFLWGTATSAHQTEGNNTNTDWWIWEQTKTDDREYPLEPSLQACDSYNRYEEDFDLCKKLNNKAVRISLEWARIEPKENEFSEKEIEHYRKVLQAAKDRGLKTFVTLHHFTNPVWFAKKGGWTNFGSPAMFSKYAQKCAEEFGDLVDTFATINEPQVYALQGYTNGTWPPNKINLFWSYFVQVNMARAHIAAYSEIKKVNKDYQVGLVKNIVWYETHSKKWHLPDILAVKILYFLNCGFYIRMLRGQIDFLGLNYYYTSRIRHLRVKNPNDWVSDLNWWINPAGLYKILLDLKSEFPKLPVYITENGLADSKDLHREKFIREMLICVSRAIEKGANVKGYFHWSLLDNYEWHHGFWPRFGLVEIDRENNLERKPRQSFYYYADICKNNGL